MNNRQIAARLRDVRRMSDYDEVLIQDLVECVQEIHERLMKIEETPDDVGEWDEAWDERVGETYEEQLERSIIEANDKLKRLNIYLDELYELNGTSLSWNAAIAKMKAIVMDEPRHKKTEDEIMEACTRIFDKMNETPNRYDYEH